MINHLQALVCVATAADLLTGWEQRQVLLKLLLIRVPETFSCCCAGEVSIHACSAASQ